MYADAQLDHRGRVRLMVRIFQPDTGQLALRVDKRSIANLTTVRQVAELVAELRYDLRTCVTPFGSSPASLVGSKGV